MHPNRQLDLFSSVLHAYSAQNSGVLNNETLYRAVADIAGVDDEESQARAPIGSSGQVHNVFERKLRWHQQTLKKAGILEHVPGERGVWRLTKPAGKDLNQIEPTVSIVGFSTELGIAILGSCDTVFQAIDAPITLVVTSPPYPLAKPRNYGNPTEAQYVDWICKQLEPIVKNLVRGGSICINLSNDIFEPGLPSRSLYRERLVLALHDRLGLHKMDELIWENKSKAPGPVKWASMARTQLNVVFEPVYWFTNDPRAVRSDNRRVLQQHTDKHLNFIRNGGEAREASYSDGAYNIKAGRFANETPGRIPRNILSYGHRCAEQLAYKRTARSMGLPVHGAPMPMKLASFLIEFLSQPGELVVDPFGGSFTTAHAAERLGRRWLSTDIMVEYVLGGATRFIGCDGYRNHLAGYAHGQTRPNGPFLMAA